MSLTDQTWTYEALKYLPNSGHCCNPPGLSMKIVLLLSAAVFINFVDRGNFATTSRPSKMNSA
jgi:hypothetical protein